MSEISDLIQQLAGTRNDDKVTLLHCKVNSVDVNKRICEVTSITGSSTLTFNAQITAGIADGFITTPEVDSMVFILMSKYTKPFVILYSDVENYVINGGEFGGLVKVVELTSKLNDLQNKVNELITRFNSLTLPVSGATAGPPLIPITGSLQLTQRADIENTTVNHGGN